MVYFDYKWTARSDNDDPDFKNHQESAELNRTEGYEMIDFIDYLAYKWNWADDNVASRQKLEKTIRTKVPSSIRTHKDIREWIEANHTAFWKEI